MPSQPSVSVVLPQEPAPSSATRPGDARHAEVIMPAYRLTWLRYILSELTTTHKNDIPIKDLYHSFLVGDVFSKAELILLIRLMDDVLKDPDSSAMDCAGAADIIRQCGPLSLRSSGIVFVASEDLRAKARKPLHAPSSASSSEYSSYGLSLRTTTPVRFIIDARVAQQFNAYAAAAAPSEIGGLLRIQGSGSDTFRAVELKMFPQRVSGATFELDSESIARFNMDLVRDGKREQLSEWKSLIHSHPGFGATMSGPDVDSLQRLAGNAYAFSVIVATDPPRCTRPTPNSWSVNYAQAAPFAMLLERLSVESEGGSLSEIDLLSDEELDAIESDVAALCATTVKPGLLRDLRADNTSPPTTRRRPTKKDSRDSADAASAGDASTSVKASPQHGIFGDDPNPFGSLSDLAITKTSDREMLLRLLTQAEPLMKAEGWTALDATRWVIKGGKPLFVYELQMINQALLHLRWHLLTDSVANAETLEELRQVLHLLNAKPKQGASRHPASGDNGQQRQDDASCSKNEAQAPAGDAPPRWSRHGIVGDEPNPWGPVSNYVIMETGDREVLLRLLAQARPLMKAKAWTALGLARRLIKGGEHLLAHELQLTNQALLHLRSHLLADSGANAATLEELKRIIQLLNGGTVSSPAKPKRVISRRPASGDNGQQQQQQQQEDDASSSENEAQAPTSPSDDSS